MVRMPLWLLRHQTKVYFYMDDFYMCSENMQSEKTTKSNITKLNEDTDGELSAVVGWPAIFAPGCHTSRNHPARKKKRG